MHFKIDYILVGFVVCLNFSLCAIQESCLYTLLPKYFQIQSRNDTNNETIISQFSCSTNNSFQTPSYVIISQIFLAKYLAMILMNPAVGCIMERLNVYFMLISGHLVGIGVSLIYAYSNTLLMYTIGRILDAFVNCSILVAAYSLISKQFVKRKTRDNNYALVNILYFVSHSIGPFFGAEIDTKYGKSIVFIILVSLWIICIIFTILLYFINKRKTNRNKTKVKNYPETLNGIGKEIVYISCESCNSPPYSVTHNNDDNNNNNNESNSNILKSIFQMLKDRFLILCFLQLFIVYLSMNSLPPTLPMWMGTELCSTEIQQGMVWTYGFFGYILGVGIIIIIDKFGNGKKYFLPIIGHLTIGILLIFLPFSRDWKLIFVPIIGMYTSVGIVDQVVFPLTIDLSNLRHQSKSHLVTSLTSQALTLSGVFSTLTCGYISMKFGFKALSISLGIINILFSPCSLYYTKINLLSHTIEKTPKQSLLCTTENIQCSS